jgi:hypothetical protein
MNAYTTVGALRRPTPGRVFRGMALAVIAALALAACNPDEALEVEDPDVVRPGDLNDKSALASLRNGVIGSFQVAYSGGGDQSNFGHEGIIQLGGLFSDELINAETFTDRINIDRRNVTAANGSMVAMYLDLSRARAAADDAARRYEELDPNTAGHAEMLALAGMTYVLFGEHFCSGVPFSQIDANENLVYGEPQTREELFNAAVAKFDDAITVATAAGDNNLVNLARVGRGRALVNLARWADAATAVATVPTSFSYDIEHSTNTDRQRNGIWHYAFNNGAFSVADLEGGVGLDYASSNDPRVDAFNTGTVGFDSETPLIISLLYDEATTPTPLATGVEARLIQAEAQLRAGNGAGMVTSLNLLRAAAGLGSVADPGSQVGREDLLFRERAFWLYLTAHRLGDMRRLVRQYGRTATTVYPQGEYFKGGDYSTNLVLPVSADERNNPNFQGCLDTNP